MTTVEASSCRREGVASPPHVRHWSRERERVGRARGRGSRIDPTESASLCTPAPTSSRTRRSIRHRRRGARSSYRDGCCAMARRRPPRHPAAHRRPVHDSRGLGRVQQPLSRCRSHADRTRVWRRARLVHLGAAVRRPPQVSAAVAALAVPWRRSQGLLDVQAARCPEPRAARGQRLRGRAQATSRLDGLRGSR